MNRFLISTVLFCFILSGCKNVQYSFSGANIEVESATVELFPNNADNGPPDLGQVFTDELKDKLTRESGLDLLDVGGEVEFRGAITGYRFEAKAPVGDDASAFNRLTITVRVEYINTTDPNDKWTKNFSRYADYDATQDLNSVEQALIFEINRQLMDDVFNAAFVKW